MMHAMDGGLPRVPPMMATLGPLPPQNQQDKWAFEMKWDGARVVAYVSAADVTLVARSGRDVTVAYPELAALSEALGGRSAVLDGEVVALDEAGRPSFEALQPRFHSTGRAPGRSALGGATRPIVYLIFDLLHLDGEPLLDLPYAERRARLTGLALAGPNWQTPPAFDGLGSAALQTSLAQHLEGVVAKRLDSRYEPGRRSPAWVKVKNVLTQEVVIGGWRTGRDSRARTFGSLLCGVHDPAGRLLYAGRVGSGFTQESLAAISADLAELARARPPFDAPVPALDARDAHWVEPVLVGEVGYSSWTRDGRLWHPVWRGMRPDKEAREIVREA